MKKNLISLILVLVWASSTALYAATAPAASQGSSSLNYVPRYDRGYSGNDYSFRIAVLNGAEHNAGGIPY